MMRLRRLSLDLFGHFSGKTYDFGHTDPGAPDFHVIYGPNEAGKTTTMEAFLRLLYGFPHQDAYGFLHQRKNLRVSGVLDIDGQPRAITRLPTRAGSLLDDTGTPLPEAVLQAHLGGLAEEDYRQLLCLDDDTIERGGQDIANSKGDIGRLLFSAAAGVSDLTGVLDQIRAQADALYRKRASTTELAQLRKDLAEVEARIKAADIPAATLRKLRHAHDTARQAEAAIRAARDDLRRRHAQETARAAALPLLAEIGALDADLAPHADYPDHLDINPEDLVDLLTRQTRARADLDRLGAEIADLTQRRAAITRHPDRLDLRRQLADLADLRARHTTADKDLPRRRKTVQDHLDQMARIARDLGADDGTDPVALVLPQAQLGELAAAREARHVTARARAAAHDEVADCTTRLDQARARLAALDAGAPVATGLGAILARFSVDTLAPKHAAACRAIADARLRLRDALDALALHDRAFDHLPPAPLATDAAEDLATRHRALTERLTLARDALAARQHELAALSAQIERATTGQGLADDAAAAGQIALRDDLWARHRAALTAETAEAFAAQMAQVDATAAARLARAADLGQLRHMQLRQAELAEQLRQAQDQTTALDGALRDLDAAVADAARAAGLPEAITAPALAGWLRKRDEAARAQRLLDHAVADHAPVLDQAARLQEALAPHVPLETPDFDAVVAAARAIASAEQAHETQRATADRACADLDAELARRIARRDDLARDQDAAANHWAALVTRFFGTTLDADALDQGFDGLQALREVDLQRIGADRQVRAMQADQTDFADRIAALARAYGMNSAPAPDAFAALHDLAEAAQQAETQHADLGTAIAEATAARDDAARALDLIAQDVARLGAIFPAHVPTDTLPDLRRAVATAQEVIEKRRRRAALVGQVCAGLGLPDLAAARQATADCTAPDLAATIATLDTDLDAIDTQLAQAIEARSTAAHDLGQITADNDVAALTERKATLEAQIEDVALRYLELDLGHRLADEAIRRYRDAHRSTMMQATEQAFAALTNGAYTRLMSQPQGNGETLLAVDAAGSAKQAQDMSKGTRFQLYLALRAAAYEQLATQGVCLPFFCDDIFETFDEDRTRAACGLMARIGRTGQAIYLTHHRHVVDIARAVCGHGVRVHELG